MRKLRTFISTSLAFALVACGGGGGSNTPTRVVGDGGTTGGTGGATTGGTTTSCSLASRKDWVLAQLQEWYLFPDLLAANVNAASYSDIQSYIDALVAPARAEAKDRYFTYITSIQEENALIQNGASAGFGIRLAYDDVARTLTVVEAFENGPAYAAGIDRGTRIVGIDSRSVTDLFAFGGAQAVSQALGPNDPGVTRHFLIEMRGGGAQSISVTKQEYSLDPVSDRNGVRIFDTPSGRIGYVNLRTFIVQSADQDLRNAFQQFQTQGVDQVVLDLRYNGGGLISIANLLGDLLGADKVGKVYSSTVFRPSKSAENTTTLFAAQPQAIAASKIAVIGREGTASASELVTNSMLAYLNRNIALIGANTYGKPVGQIGLDRSACDDRLRVVALKTTNANGQGEYYKGLASVMSATCQAPDDLSHQLGDPAEASIASAINYLNGRACTPISATAPSGTAAQRAPTPELLMSREPSAAQLHVPGLF